MSILKIVQVGNPILRKRAEEVTKFELKSEDFQKFIDDLIETFKSLGGVGLAAPQVGVSKRVFVMEIKKGSPRYPNPKKVPLKVFINLRIIKASRAKSNGWEGCFSVDRELFGEVSRPKEIVVEALDRKGKKKRYEAEDLFARIIQHEIDHLDGKIFFERMKDMRKLTKAAEFEKYWI